MDEKEYPTDFCIECKYGKYWKYSEDELENSGGGIVALICGFECPFYREKEMNKGKLKIEIKMDWDKYSKEVLKEWEERKRNWKKWNIG